MWKLYFKWLFWLMLGWAIIASLIGNVLWAIVVGLLWGYIVFSCAEKQGGF